MRGAETARVFVDTNLFFYAQDARFPEKQQRARLWLQQLADQGVLLTNLQVVNEFANVVSKRMAQLDKSVADTLTDAVARFGTTAITIETVLLTRSVRDQTNYSWWDCLLLASALELGCSHFLSEDLQDAQIIGTMTVVDPFGHEPSLIE